MDDREISPDVEGESPFPETVTVVGVRVRELGETKKARTTISSLQVGDHVILQLDGDLTYGLVVTHPQVLPFIPPMRVMKIILRKATEEDTISISNQKRLAKEGMDYCRERALALGLRMKLVEVYGAFERRILTFSYTADGRIDFRQLVKDLARHFSCRIEMQQISSREEARCISGVDTCGLVLCCASFLTDFKPVNQRLSRSEGAWTSDSHRIGVCGRLKCCLMFEQDDCGQGGSSRGTLIQLNKN